MLQLVYSPPPFFLRGINITIVMLIVIFFLLTPGSTDSLDGKTSPPGGSTTNGNGKGAGPSSSGEGEHLGAWRKLARFVRRSGWGSVADMQLVEKRGSELWLQKMRVYNWERAEQTSIVMMMLDKIMIKVHVAEAPIVV